MKILGIAGSPRPNGNSTLLVREALRAAGEAGAETELFLLREKKDLRHCLGCWTCLKTGKCCQPDDMREIYLKLEAADGIIIGSPSHAGSVSSLCQVMLERSVCLFRFESGGDRPLHTGKNSVLSGKVGGSIVTGRRRGVQGPLDTLNYFFLMHRIVLAHAGVAGFCQSLEPGAIAREDKDAVNMAAELGKIVVDYAKRLAASRAAL